MIRLLNQDTINKIAAGEVVERPISVIKELVENSIDAGSTAITVEIEDGGLKLIRITDNGIGMTRDDIKNAFLRHATSKIEDATDLNAIHSLGFRGEALASIAAVSMVDCMTKTKDSITGTRYSMEGGIEKAFEDIGCPNGTTFVVRELFYNVPARKKFIKSPKTEGSYVSDLINRMALSHPGISFKYMMNGKVKLHTSGNYSLKDCIYQVFGKEYAKDSKEVNYENGPVKITGFVGEPILSRGNRQYEIYFVNGRYIKSKWIQRGIEDGAKEGMMINQFPFAVLFLEISYDLVDVNVHPNKMEVRFDQEEEIRHHFREAILLALHKREPIVNVKLNEDLDQEIEKRIVKEEKKLLKEAPEPFETKRMERFGYKGKTVGYSKNDNTNRENDYREKVDIKETPKTEQKPVEKKEIELQNQKPIEETAKENKEPDEGNVEGQQVEVQNMNGFLDSQQVKKHFVIGQAFKTYWIVQYANELYIVDQHAAHEKVLYEAWVKAVRGMDIPSQVLLEPMVYELSDREFHVYETFKDDILKLGFDVEGFGGNTIIVKSVPYLLNTPMNNLDFIHFFDQLVEGEASIKREDQYLHRLASVACKAAIKGNDKLSVIEYKSLVEQLLILEDPYHCPHGRPTMIRMSKYELEKKFRRIV